MKTEWDYTNLADAYLKRPDYAMEAIDKMIALANLKDEANVCDVGAGAAHLTLMLAARNYNVTAIEPNDAMRKNGIKRTEMCSNVMWYEGVGENTGQKDSIFDLVTFGSSFNVTDRQLTLKETKRILKPHGWFACMWNHRVLEDSVQNEIENIIKKYIRNYNYGTRREDQTEVINQSGLFGDVYTLEDKVVHDVPVNDLIEGWRSHGTVQRQAGENFMQIVSDIEKYILSLGKATIAVPYVTRVWMAQAL